MLAFVREELQLDPLIAAAIERGAPRPLPASRFRQVDMRMLAAGAVIAAVPVAALILLAAVRMGADWPRDVRHRGDPRSRRSLLALRWSRDLDLLADNVRRIAADEPCRAARRCCPECNVSVPISSVWRVAPPCDRRWSSSYGARTAPWSSACPIRSIVPWGRIAACGAPIRRHACVRCRRAGRLAPSRSARRNRSRVRVGDDADRRGRLAGTGTLDAK